MNNSYILNPTLGWVYESFKALIKQVHNILPEGYGSEACAIVSNYGLWRQQLFDSTFDIQLFFIYDIVCIWW